MDIVLGTLILIALTFIPALELRFSIPVGILATSLHLPFFGQVQGFSMPWWYVFIVCVLANIFLAFIFYHFLHFIVHGFLVKHWGWFARFYQKRVEKAQKKIHKHVERWGWLGLALFIAVPLPGSGVYTGGVAGYALGFSFKRFMYASIIGVVIAGIVVTLVTLGVVNVIEFF